MMRNTHARLQSFALRLGFQRDWYLIALGAVIGAVTAVGAVGFMKLLHLATRGADALLNSWPLWALPLLPMLGGLGAGLLITRYASEAKGHGVPEVMEALYRKGGKIRRRVAMVKAVASAITIGSGGSAGAEGPIVQIGAGISSSLAQALHVSREQAGTLLGCGAAAGIASVFNAPIAGVFFVLEILLRDFSLRTFTPIVIASVFSTAVTQSLLGVNDALFAGRHVLAGYQFTLRELPSYILLGLICGGIGVAFIRALYATEDAADKLKAPPALKPVIGALILGLLGIAFVLIAGAAGVDRSLPAFFGNGYESIKRLLSPGSYGMVVDLAALGVAAPVEQVSHVATFPMSVWLLLTLLVFKLAATCCTLGSGGSGGIFAPALFLGASAGAAFGVALQSIGLVPEGSTPATYALVGMAAVIASSTHAPLTAILIVFEITRDVYVLLPIMLAAVLSTVVAQILLRDSIYTLKLRRRGVLIGSSADLTILRRLTADLVPLVPHVAVHPEEAVSKLLELNRNYQVVDFVVTDDDGRYLGMVTAQDLRTALIEREAIPLLLVDDIYRSDLPCLDPDETLDAVLDKFSRNDVSSLVVVANGPLNAKIKEGAAARPTILGLLTRGRLMRRYQQALAES